MEARVKLQRKILRDLAKQYKVELKFKKLKDVSGYFKAPNTIVVGIDQNFSRWQHHSLVTFFHELGHRYCYINNIHKDYHKPKRTWSAYVKMIRVAFRAEKWVDKWGEREFNLHFSNLKWIKSYRTKKDEAWIKSHLMNQMTDMMNEAVTRPQKNGRTSQKASILGTTTTGCCLKQGKKNDNNPFLE